MKRAGSSSTAARIRHKSPPRPSRLQPAQYARLFAMIGATLWRSSAFVIRCRRLLESHAYGGFSADELLDEAVLRVFLGNLPEKMRFPGKRKQLIEAVVRLGKLHADNTSRNRRRHRVNPVSIDEGEENQLQNLPAAGPLPSLQTLQLDILERLEEQLLVRMATLRGGPARPTNETSPGLDWEITLS